MKKLLLVLSQPLLLSLTASTVYAATQLTVPNPVNVPTVDLGKVISAVVGILLLIAAILAFLYLILGGIQWITSGGDKSGMEAARNKITAAIVGLIIVAAAWAIMMLIGNFIGFNILSPSGLKLPCVQDPTGANCP